MDFPVASQEPKRTSKRHLRSTLAEVIPTSPSRKNSAVPTETGRDPRLILLLGSPRSGTSWLASILNSNPFVMYRHEPFTRFASSALEPALKQLKNEGLLPENQRRQFLEALVHASSECHRPPFFDKSFLKIPPSAQWLLWMLSRIPGPGESLLRRLSTPATHARYDLLIKEIDWSRQAESLVQGLRPELLIIRRHPCGVVNSLLQGQRRGLMVKHDRITWFQDHQACCASLGYSIEAIQALEDFEFLALQWLEQNLTYEAAARQARRCRFIEYEELCQSPEHVSRDIFQFLRWPMGQETIHFLRRSTQGERSSLRTWLGGKRQYFGVYKDSKEVCDAWKTQLTSEQCRRILKITNSFTSSQFSSRSEKNDRPERREQNFQCAI